MQLVQYQFTTDELNCQFPYFILMDKQLNILSYGNMLSEIINLKIAVGVQFDKIFHRNHEVDFPTIDLRMELHFLNSNYFICGKWIFLSTHGIFLFSGERLLQRTKVNESRFERSIQPGKYDGILSNMQIGFVELSTHGEIEYANDSISELLGYKFDELRGRELVEFFGHKHFDFHSNEPRALYNFRLEFKDRLNQRKWVLINQSANIDEAGKVLGYIVIVLDITQYKIEKNELIQARKQAELLANSKELFLANMSHEIRTPMNAIITMANELSKSKLTEEQEYSLQTIQSASSNLLVIIDDILDLSKIDAGKMNLEAIGFSLDELLSSAFRLVIYKGEKKGLDMIAENIDKDISPILIGDPFRINQVVLNILSNAVKFTENGGVVLSAYLLLDDIGHQEIEVRVRDTGIGMDADFVEHLFENFSQESQSVSRRYGGTGLGMSISKKIISQMGGHFNVVSARNVGSTISFILRLKKGTSDDLKVESPMTVDEELFKSRKMLVVDDNEMNGLVASTILLNYGAQVKVADSGKDAIKILTNETYDVVFMDVQMPDLNGYDTTKEIRRNGYKGTILALTASAINGERERCIAAGMDDYITKPIKEELFISIISKWIEKTPKNNSELELPRQLFNLDGLRNISKGREDFVTKMIELFCKRVPVDMASLTNALEIGDIEMLGNLAHKLKSTIDNLAVISIQRTIRDLEHLSKSGESINELEKLVNMIIDTLSLVIDELNMELLNRKN